MNGESIGQEVPQIRILHLLRLGTQNLRRRTARFQEEPEGVPFQTRVFDGARRFRRLLPAVHEDQNLQKKPSVVRKFLKV